MAIYQFEDRKPEIGESTYVSKSASVIGKVTLGAQCYVAPGAIVKGDYGEVVIGPGTSVQDNVVVDARPNELTTVGSRVTLGHSCIIHNATVEDEAVIGMGAIVSDYATIGRWAVVAEGAVVKARDNVPAEKVVGGIPAKVIAHLRENHKQELDHFKDKYIEMAERYHSGLTLID
ncbi:MAG: gamma carbonic anhydrase family protein [Promethearchaeia archaeon]